MKLWMWKFRGTNLVPAAFRTRGQAIAYAVERCMGAGEYERLASNSKRWKVAHKRGHRVVRVTVSET